MKRKSLFFISTLALFGSIYSPPKTYAEVIYDDKTYYTVSDILNIGEEVEKAKIAECGENYDFECGREITDRLMFESGEQKYMLYDLVQHSHLIFSSFNPSQNTAAINYRDEDDEMFRWTGVKERYEMKELYLYWLDPAIDTEYVHILQWHIDSIKDGTYDPSLVHVLFAGYNAADFEWLTPNENSTIPLNSEAGYSKTQPIHFHAVTNGNSYGNVDIRECLNSDSYKDGMDCVKIINKDDAVSRFVPILLQPESQESDIEDTDVTDEPEMPEFPETPEILEPLDEPKDSDESKSSDEPEDIGRSEEFETKEEPGVAEEKTKTVEEDTESTEEKDEPAQEPNEATRETNPIKEKEPEFVQESVNPETASTADVVAVATSVAKSNPVIATNSPEEARVLSNSTVNAQDSLELPTSNIPDENENNPVENKRGGFLWWTVAIITAASFLIIWFIVPAKKKRKQ